MILCIVDLFSKESRMLQPLETPLKHVINSSDILDSSGPVALTILSFSQNVTIILSFSQNIRKVRKVRKDQRRAGKTKDGQERPRTAGRTAETKDGGRTAETKDGQERPRTGRRDPGRAGGTQGGRDIPLRYTQGGVQYPCIPLSGTPSRCTQSCQCTSLRHDRA